MLELRVVRNHAVIVLVSVVDRRIVPALRFVSSIGIADTRALHLSTDPAETRRLAKDWMDLDLSWLPLHIRDAGTASVPASVWAAVREEAAANRSVTVVLPELDSDRWWHALLHRRAARRIAARLQSLPGVTAVIVPFWAPGDARLGALRAAPPPTAPS